MFFGLLMSLNCPNIWLSLIFMIFMIGGLMISFFYMVSLSHNILASNSLELGFSFVMIFLYFLNFIKLKYKIYSLYLLKFSFFNWMNMEFQIFIIFMMILLFLMLFFIDYKLKNLKGFMKEI